MTHGELVEEFMETPVIKRLLSAENLLMATGRLGQFHGKTIQEELTTIAQRVREETIEEISSKVKANRNTNITTTLVGFNEKTGLFDYQVDNKSYNLAIEDILSTLNK